MSDKFIFEKCRSRFDKQGKMFMKIRVHAGVAKTEVKDVLADGTVKINIAAAPEKGRANHELVRFLAREFAVLPENVKIIRGAGDKNKLVRIGPNKRK